MSITKKTVLGNVSFDGEYKILHVQKLTQVIETIDEKENLISETSHRVTYTPDTLNKPFSFNEKLPENLVPYVSNVWTDELVEKYIAHVKERAEEAENAE